MKSLRLAALACLPRRALSRATGCLGDARLPRRVVAGAVAAYARWFRVDLSESERPPGGWPTFNDFFARPLRPGLRPPDPDPSAVLSPVDGRVHAAGDVERGAAFQAKGVAYRLSDLLGSEADAAAFEGGSFATLYLSPRDYHRIHWPCDARATRLRHFPGDLWPVDPVAAAQVPRLLARNERVAVFGEVGGEGGAPFALVPVGALNVGSIRLAFHPCATNRGAWTGPRDVSLDPAVAARRGEEFGRFAFGSAVVLLLSASAGRLSLPEAGAAVRCGMRIGTLAPR